MNLEQLKERALKLASEMAPKFNEVNRAIFDFAELASQEYKSSSYLAKEFSELGFSVTYPYAGLATSFRAEFGSGHPKIAFMANYDALPGFGANKDKNGHACGHNWIAANVYGACAVLKQLKQNFPGTIVCIGCPAEEGIGAKADLVKAGAFDDIDVAMQIHIAGGNYTDLCCTMLAIDVVEFEFDGVATHASASPEHGINALNACYLTFNGIDALRQHITADARIHGIITKGGEARNIVPAHCEASVCIRAKQRNYLNMLTKKVINCAKGAALMTGATMHWHYFGNSHDNLIQNTVLKKLMYKNLQAAGEPKESIYYDMELAPSSTDVGNVSQVCPTVLVLLAAHNSDGSDCHEEKFLKYVTGEKGFVCQDKAVKANILTALDLFCVSGLLDEAKEEFNKQKNQIS